MNNLKAIIAGVMLAATTSATAGGILTNTNQSIDFLRNPARDAAIGLDGVYSNPAGIQLAVRPPDPYDHQQQSSFRTGSQEQRQHL